LLLIGILGIGLMQFRRRQNLQPMPSIPLPTNVRSALNNFRNFITRSTDNINIVRFRNARPNTTSTTSTMESPPVFSNPMFNATTSSKQSSVSNEPAKLNVELHPPPSKPNRKSLYSFLLKYHFLK
ncbi:unnamed protein product, partial [Adineta steineri]